MGDRVDFQRLHPRRKTSMNLNCVKFFAYALILGLSLGISRLPAQAQGHVVGNVFIPDSSVELPGDVGVRSHTNHLLLINPRGGLGPGGGITPPQIRTFYNMASAR